ncbi:MAG: aromatic hydrocarbon degradation protein, partial [Ginsengibacter sp.]
MNRLKLKITLLVFSLFSTGFLFAQEPADGLRFSYLTQNGGTARTQAIGGAGASLGGEFSSLFINPAGLGFYKTGDFVITPNYSMNNNKVTYLNNPENSTKNNFSLGATGLVFAVPSSSKSVSNISVGIGINKVADFNNLIYYKGKNTQSSYSEKYLEELIRDNVTDPNNAAKNYPYGSSLAINTYLIDPTYDGGGHVNGYKTAANPNTGLNQENTINTRGGITDISIGAAANIQDKWYFGGSLSVPYLSYKRDATYRESDASGNTNNGFNFFETKESLQTTGIGIGAKFGAIFKPVKYFRIGAAIHTPTFYQLTDNYVISMATDLEGSGGI